MIKKFSRYKAAALVCSALLFLAINSAFAQSLWPGGRGSASDSADYLCEFGKSFYAQNKIEDALTEFNKVLLIDPGNETAKDFINRIFRENSAVDFEPTVIKVSFPENPAQKHAQDVLSGHPALSDRPVRASAQQPAKSALTREETMDLTLNKLKRKEDLSHPPYVTIRNLADAEDKKEGIIAGPLKVSGVMQLSFGITPDEFIWKRANYDLNEKIKSWRVSSDAGLNNRFNTFDPRVYDSLSVDMDTENKDGFNFHSNVTVDPWSFTGKSDKITLANGADAAEIQLFYWSGPGYVKNSTFYSTSQGTTIDLPELKVVDGKTSPVTIAGFNIPQMKIERQFQPVRELWLDYANDQIKFRMFPIAYQDQAYSSDDPLGITNHRIWWQDSMWLRRYAPGVYHSGNVPVDFTKGYWDDSLSFISKDSASRYLTSLRGFSFSFQPGEGTSFDTTIATPKHLWQDYGQIDNLITASRLKHYLTDNFMIGSTLTSRLGFKVDDGNKLDSQNYVGGVDLGYEVADGLKAQAEVLTSKSFYDQSNPDYETESRGNAYYFAFITRYPQQNIMDLKYGYDEISMNKTESFLIKSKFYASRMDKGFDSALSNYHNTRQDTFWSRHIHFRRPFDYYYAGLTKPTTRWNELAATRIGDGIDSGRNIWGFRIEFIAEDKFSNLFDVRNVHDVNGKFIENVVRDEATVKLTDKLTAKILGIYQKLPNTLGGVDPFIFDGNTGKFFDNASVADGQDPTLKTGSIGLNYDFFDWLSLDGIYERTNDYSLAYDGFPANTLRNDTTLSGTYYQNDKLYRFRDPFLTNQGIFPQAPYEFYNIFKTGLRMQPMDSMDIYLDYTRNEFESAGQNSDSMNHVGIELTYMPTETFGMALKYTYSRWQDIDRLAAGQTSPFGHHNFFSEFRYLPSKDDEFILQYGEGNTSNLGNMTLDPYGGSALTIDTAHIFRAYYRRKF